MDKNGLSIAVIGAGNSGQAVAADLALAGNTVSLYEMPRFISNIAHIVNSKQIELEGSARQGIAKLYNVSCNLKEILNGVDLIFIATVSIAHEEIAEQIAEFIHEDQILVLTPGSLGSLVFAKAFRKAKKKVTIAETVTLPYACRITEPGKVKVTRVVAYNPIACLPGNKTEDVCAILKQLYPALEPWDNVIEVGLHNTNIFSHPIPTLLNIARIEYSKGEFRLYKEGFTPTVFKVLRALEKEKAGILSALGLRVVPYEELVLKVRGISWDEMAKLSSKGPSSANHRYLTEDVLIGISLISSFGKTLGIPTPIANSVLAITSAMHDKNYEKEGRTVESIGLGNMDKEEILKYIANGSIA